MQSSQGRFLKEKIQQHGYKITAVAQHLGISRRALYKIFAKDDGINVHLLARIGTFIKYDFSNDFPSMKSYMQAHNYFHFCNKLAKVHVAYIDLLEDYCKLFNFTAKVLSLKTLAKFYENVFKKEATSDKPE